MPQLTVKVLSARKRARDWKQQEYSSRVLSALAAMSAVPKFAESSACDKDMSKLRAAGGSIARSELLRHLMSAQEEVCQLLHSSQQQLQQQQQGQSGMESLQLLQLIAHDLLRCWMITHPAWILARDKSDGGAAGPAAFQAEAVDLAAVLAQTLTEHSPAWLFAVVVKVAYR